MEDFTDFFFAFISLGCCLVMGFFLLIASLVGLGVLAAMITG